jgi:ABC-type phosphate transport system permease subunit
MKKLQLPSNILQLVGYGLLALVFLVPVVRQVIAIGIADSISTIILPSGVGYFLAFVYQPSK